jgi:hypothetical protein
MCVFVRYGSIEESDCRTDNSRRPRSTLITNTAPDCLGLIEIGSSILVSTIRKKIVSPEKRNKHHPTWSWELKLSRPNNKKRQKKDNKLSFLTSLTTLRIYHEQFPPFPPPARPGGTTRHAKTD